MEFDWDEGNRDKNLKHGVHDREIEEAFADPRRLLAARLRVGDEPRYISLARAATSGTYLRFVYTVRIRGGRRRIRPTSAIAMSERNKRRYRRSR